MAKEAPESRRSPKRDIESYAHTDKERVNNPPMGLAALVVGSARYPEHPRILKSKAQPHERGLEGSPRDVRGY